MTSITFFYALCLLLVETSLQSTPDNNENIVDVQLFQGDIILTNGQQKLLEQSNDGIQSPQNAVFRLEDFKWPGGIIPYELDSSLYETAVTAIYEAMYDFQNNTCVQFKPKTPEDEDFVKFYKGYGCSSLIGRTTGQQEISIGEECDKKGIVIHEIFHALGRWHEQSRSDRNQYVLIYPENIRPGYENNFGTISKAFATTQGVPYDYDSVMHYPIDAFSINDKPTILPTNQEIDIERLGQRTGLSVNDIVHVRALYCGDGDGQWSGWGTWSPCSKTCNGGTRKRMRTCIGEASCMGTSIQESVCQTEECPIPPQWGEWSVWSGCTALCGGGRQRRIRTCLNGNICEGLSDEYKDCNNHDCPNSLSNWSSWSKCSATCATANMGYRYRSRYCPNGKSNNCTGETRQGEECSSDIECEQWTDCNRSCGGGTQVNLVTQETKACNEIPCHKINEMCLEGISHIGCYKLSLLKGAVEYLEETSEHLTEDPSNRTEPIRKCAQSAHSINRPYFILALGLCYSGSNELQSYFDNEGVESGVCRNGTGNYYGSTLIGDVYYIEDDDKFEASSDRAENCGFDYCRNLNASCDIIYSGSNNITGTSNIALVLSLSLLLLIFIIL